MPGKTQLRKVRSTREKHHLLLYIYLMTSGVTGKITPSKKGLNINPVSLIRTLQTITCKITGMVFLITIMASMHSVVAQEFTCDGSFYFVATDRAGESRFYQLMMKEADKTFEYEEIPLKSDRKRHITCLGYNVKDKMIYGLDFNSYELLRIEKTGRVTSLGIPENLDTSFKYYAGDMTADGKSLMVLARNPKTGYDERTYSIQVNNPPRYYAGYLPLVSDVPVALADFTVDPIVGVTYGFDNINGQVVTKSGLISSSHSPFPIKKVKEGFGALFFDRYGQMYGLGSPGRPGGEQNIIYQIDKARGGTEKLGKVIGGEDSDGCGCPFTIDFQKKITPTQIVGCDQVIIEYNVINRAGIGQVGLHLTDIFPPDFDITRIFIGDNLFDVNSGPGSNRLEIANWTLLLGENKFTLEVGNQNPVPRFTGSQAELHNLPTAFEPYTLSDDPVTPQLRDTTRLAILDVVDIRLGDYQWTSCNADTTFLTLPMSGEFLWSDGSTQPVLPVLEDGWYAVTLLTDCLVFSDTIRIVKNPELLELNIGSDLQLDLGTKVKLGMNTNAKKITSIQWGSTDDLSLDCLDCSDPELSAAASGMVFATITDHRGCSVSDTIRILLDDTKRIFVPNAFSPNGDGINDVLYIYGPSVQIIDFKVFNRWGSLVFQTSKTDFAIGWDGSHQGTIQGSGTYLWSAEVVFPDRKRERFNGTVVILD